MHDRDLKLAFLSADDKTAGGLNDFGGYVKFHG
jgi:hypothetical protein